MFSLQVRATKLFLLDTGRARAGGQYSNPCRRRITKAIGETEAGKLGLAEDADRLDRSMVELARPGRRQWGFLHHRQLVVLDIPNLQQLFKEYVGVVEHTLRVILCTGIDVAS